MTKKDNGGEIIISKLVVVIMIVLIILAAATYLWIDYNNESKSSDNNMSTGQTEVDEQQTETIDENATLDSEAVGDEIDSLDQKVNSINDDTLSEDSLSDNDLGI